MTIAKMIQWVVMCLIAGAGIYLIQLPLRRSEKNWAKWLRLLLWPVKAFLVILLAHSTISVALKVVWEHEYLFGALYVALCGDVLSDLVCLLIRKKKARLFVTALLTIAYLVFGMANEAVIRPTCLSYTSEKLSNSYKIAYVSDVHYGSAQFPSAVRKALEKIRDEKPDYLLLGGDLVDEHSSKEDMEELFAMIGELDLPTFYTYGNHDLQEHGELVGGNTFTKEELDRAITENGITILCNDVAVLADDLTLIGIDDISHKDNRMAIEDLPESDPDSYRIFLDHSPYNTEDSKKLGADLQLSGHTHAGQFFPLRLIYHFMVPATYADYQVGDTTLFVSAGLGGWYFPFRSEAKSEYLIVNLSPEK